MHKWHQGTLIGCLHDLNQDAALGTATTELAVAAAAALYLAPSHCATFANGAPPSQG